MLCTLMSCEMLPLILSYVNESKKKMLKTTQNFEAQKLIRMICWTSAIPQNLMLIRLAVSEDVGTDGQRTVDE